MLVSEDQTVSADHKNIQRHTNVQRKSQNTSIKPSLRPYIRGDAVSFYSLNRLIKREN
ncbi:hypothetical protein ACEQPO_01000 [Bacillus sp. SL00103]